MDKARLAAELSRRTGLSSAQAQQATEAMFAIIGEQVASGRSVDVADFGRFRARGLGKVALRYGDPMISFRGDGGRPKLVLRSRPRGGRPGSDAAEEAPAGDPTTDP